MDQNLLRNEVRSIHQQQGILYKHMANKVGITPSYFSFWLSGERNLSAEKSARIEEYVMEVKEC